MLWLRKCKTAKNQNCEFCCKVTCCTAKFNYSGSCCIRCTTMMKSMDSVFTLTFVLIFFKFNLMTLAEAIAKINGNLIFGGSVIQSQS